MKELKKFEKKFGEYINKEQQKIKEIVNLNNFLYKHSQSLQSLTFQKNCAHYIMKRRE